MSDTRKRRSGGAVRKQLQDSDENRHSSHAHASTNRPYKSSKYSNTGGRRGANSRVNCDDVKNDNTRVDVNNVHNSRSDVRNDTEVKESVKEKTPTDDNCKKDSTRNDVRKIVQEEGRTARNLIVWNVPVERTGRSMTRKETAHTNVSSPPCSPKPKHKSADRDIHKSPSVRKKVDMRARYWAFMFDNIKRAVDAIYKTCEEDESVVECKEVIMMLDQSTRDFKNLIERLNVMRAYEEATKEGDRPTSIAWEVRKMSPGKTAPHLRDNSSGNRRSNVQRTLSFSNPDEANPALKPRIEDIPPVKPSNSWADMVKATHAPVVKQHPPGPTKQEDIPPVKPRNSWADMVKATHAPVAKQHPPGPTKQEDKDGWETVQRNARNKPRPLSATSKQQQPQKQQLSQQHQQPRANKVKSRNATSLSNSNRATGRKNYDGGKVAQKSVSCGDVANTGKNNRDSEKENEPSIMDNLNGLSIKEEIVSGVEHTLHIQTDKNGLVDGKNREVVDRKIDKKHDRNGGKDDFVEKNGHLINGDTKDQNDLKDIARKDDHSVDKTNYVFQDSENKNDVTDKDVNVLDTASDEPKEVNGVIEEGISDTAQLTSQTVDSNCDHSDTRQNVNNNQTGNAKCDKEKNTQKGDNSAASDNTVENDAKVNSRACPDKKSDLSDRKSEKHGAKIKESTDKLNAKKSPTGSGYSALKPNATNIESEVKLNTKSKESGLKLSDISVESERKNIKSELNTINMEGEKENTNNIERELNINAHNMGNIKLNDGILESETLSNKVEITSLTLNVEGSLDPTENASLTSRSRSVCSNDDLLSNVDSVETMDVAALHDKALATVLDNEELVCTELEKRQEQALEQVLQEEETWLQELARERSKEIDVDLDVDTDDLTTSQTTNDSLDTSYTDDILGDVLERVIPLEAPKPVSWADMTDDDVYIPPFLLASHGWPDLDLDETERTPGHAVLMHEKLSSPSRKRSVMETKLRHEQKQAKAFDLRQKLLQEKSENLRMISTKIEEVRSNKEELLLQRKITIDRKMKRADEKRCLQLREKALKAHEEEAKANEIAFINTLEAQNKRHDIIAKHQESEARLHELHEERQKRLGEKQAKEAAVEERKKALDAERAARLLEMQEKRKQRDARVEQQQIEKEKERVETMRLKEKDKIDRLAALNAQQQAHIEELQKKIQQKQDESHRRHQEVLAEVQHKAFEMAVMKHSTEDHNDAPTPTPYDRKKICTVCNILIHSEVYLLSHIRGKRHKQSLQESCKGLSKQDIGSFNVKSIVDAPQNSTHPKITSEKERQKALKRRCKKLRLRMVSRGQEYETSMTHKTLVVESQHKAKLQKITKDLTKYLQSEDRGPWPQNKVSALERGLGEITRIIDKKIVNDQLALRSLGGMTSLCRLLLVISDSTPSLPPVLPTKTLVNVCNVLRAVCKGCYDNCYYMLFNNKLGTLVDLLSHQMNIMMPDHSPPDTPIPHNPIVTALMNVMSTIISCLAKNNPAVTCSEAAAERIGNTGDAFVNRANDIISYIVCVGIADKISLYFSKIQGSINDQNQVAELLHQSLGLLSSITKLLSRRNSNPFEGPPDDQTQLINTFQATELVGIVSLLYSTLLHSGTPARGDTPPPELPTHTLAFITTGIRTINTIALLDLKMLQGVLGEEGTWLQLRHISSYLLWYCMQYSCDELLHEVIYAVGYFTVLNTDNQLVIQSGQSPTVLQQLCALPFHYFSDPRLTNILFPTIMSCCYRNDENREILEQELSGALIANFIEEKQLELQQGKLTPSLGRKGVDKDKSRTDPDSRTSFFHRFPQDQLDATIEYFSSE